MDKDDGDTLLSWCDEMEAKYTSPTEYDYGVLMAVAGLRKKLAALRQSGAGSKDLRQTDALGRLNGAIRALYDCKQLIAPANWPDYAQQVLDHNDAALKERT